LNKKRQNSCSQYGPMQHARSDFNVYQKTSDQKYL